MKMYMQLMLRDSTITRRVCTLQGVASLIVVLFAMFSAALYAKGQCADKVYLTLDTGNMRHAELIAEILQRQQVRVTFFLANEKTFQGGYSLDDRWQTYWRTRVAEGHAFGTHSWDHGYFRQDLPDGKVVYQPLFGPSAGQRLTWDATAVCRELQRVDQRFVSMTGRRLDPYWRAPGGRTTKNSLAAAQQCGYRHVGWAPAGFLGDELPSEKFSNQVLLDKALREVRSGDILMAHLGIWSRKEAYAPMLEPLIIGLKKRGLCFATLREHPEYQ